MRILVYEFVSGGGWYHVAGEPPPESLAREGRAMLAAVASDLAGIPGAEVQILCDARHAPLELPGVETIEIYSAAEERRAFTKQAPLADWTLLIAPEFDSYLLERVRLVERNGGRLLGPSSQVVALASDKQVTAEHLARHGVPVPVGWALAAGEPLPADLDYPAVLKPRDGAGSQGIRWIPGRTESDVSPFAARLERYAPGTAVSVSCLCGEGLIVPLVPCGQQLAGGGDFAYQGGWLPLEPALAARARRLAVRAAQTLPGPRGYLGIDLVLGADPAGSGDVVVEINPRLTTSYVGLRVASQINLAAAMIDVAAGRAVELCWKSEAVRFSSSGTCVPSTAHASNR